MLQLQNLIAIDKTGASAATNSGLLDLTSSVQDIQGGTISNTTYWYQQSQSGAWVQCSARRLLGTEKIIVVH